MQIINSLSSPQQIADETRRYFQKVYGWMFLGLTITGLVAFYVSTNKAIYETIFGNSLLFWGLLGLELLLVFTLAGAVQKMSAHTAIFLYLAYCFVTGLTLSVIFLVYTIGSIGYTFFLCALIFALLSLYGFRTKADLTSLGPILGVGLFAIIIASVINLFVQNSQTDFIISIVGIIVFSGLTIYDTQKIKKLNIIGNEGTEEDTKESIIGALELYLDFINLFLKLLRLLGKRK
jgi:FtsH-binding integral membrane protein